MLLRSKATDRSADLNMTPMIDIVFQLILFFLFSLRFKSLDWRIDGRLPPVGPDFSPPVALPPHLRASLFRLDAEDPALARTRVRFSGEDWVLPDASRDDVRARDAFVERLSRRFASLRAAVPDLRGEIDTPQPSGSFVPHGDVVAVLDAFMKAEFHDVDFVGAPVPRPRSR